MFDKVIDLAEQRALEITKEGVRLIHKERLSYLVNVPQEILAERLLPALQVHLKYLRFGNIEEWKTTISGFVEERSKQGVDYNDMIRAGQLIAQALGEFFERELSGLTTFGGEPTAKILAGLRRRLQGMDMLGISTATSTGLKNIAKQVKDKQT